MARPAPRQSLLRPTQRFFLPSIDRVVPLHAQHALIHAVHLVLPWIGSTIGAVVLALVVVDALANNWALNDFVGNALQFRTPVAPLASPADLASYYTFGAGFGVANLSLVGHWMVDSTVRALANNSGDVYLLTAGTYTVEAKSPVDCAPFARNYTVDLATPVRLAYTDDSVTFLRGDSISHAFTNDLTENLPPSNASIAALEALGYHGARMQVKLHMTTIVPVVNTSTPQTAQIAWFLVYAKSFCTGCTPIAQLGRGVCNLTYAYVASTKTLQVKSSTSVVGSTFDLGLMFHRNVYSTIATILKYIGIFLAGAGFLASRKTVQWRDADDQKIEAMWSKVVDTIAPKYFPHLSHAIRFDLFCYNSDLCVVLFVASNLIDMQTSIMYLREVNVFNEVTPNFGMSLQLFAISTRLLWMNVGLVKLAKIVVHVVAPASYSGQSRLMGLLNLSSVTALYLSAIMLYYVPPYIEYNNKSRVDVRHKVEQLDGTRVDFFDSFYFRGSPAIGIGLVLNMAGVLAFDQVTLFAFWRRLKKNSLSRQAMYNSTSVLCEYVDDVHHATTDDKSAVMECKARRLSTLQWYFMSHMLCFGLPEKEMAKKKGVAVTATTTKDDPTSDGTNNVYIVAQDEGGHLFLLDDHLVAVKSLAFNIKILRNTAATIK
ncbi:Aste57867_18544 [Aphanomyces stellatus]|uniref:Aste57867_18544 protein n=1 Tax=Aphanomyces stellatus TaxID=120398 RepID=A0A485LAZ2_9STRA|nr:hypothetical protein As57867_018482 [Aphanomyces stellatus]VFT95280.1 Aste57867_18544 [Aphanomyces stellatus]